MHGVIIADSLNQTADTFVQTAIHTYVHTVTFEIWDFTLNTLLIHIGQHKTFDSIPKSISFMHRNHSIYPLWTWTVISTSYDARTRFPLKLNFVNIQFFIFLAEFLSFYNSLFAPNHTTLKIDVWPVEVHVRRLRLIPNDFWFKWTL